MFGEVTGRDYFGHSGCSGLYPHIPHEEGLQALREALTNSPDDLARLALSNNNLSLVENITYNSGEMLSVLKRLLRMQTFS